MNPSGLNICAVGALLPDELELDSLLKGESPDDATGLVQGFDAKAELGRKGLSTLDRLTVHALAASARAFTQLDRTSVVSERTGIVAATTNGSWQSVGDFVRATLVEERPYLVNPLLFPNCVMNAAGGNTAIRLGLTGPNTTVAGADVAGLQALRIALSQSARGMLDEVLVFGAEEVTSDYALLHSDSRTRGERLSEGSAAVYLSRHRDGASRLVAARCLTSITDATPLTVADCLDGLLADAEPTHIVLTTPLDKRNREALSSRGQVIDLVVSLGNLRSASAIAGLAAVSKAFESGSFTKRDTVVLVGQGNQGELAAAAVVAA